MVRGQSSKGKQKIEIKPIQKEASRDVTFSKRRSGLFKKANELSILCGAEIAVIVFSPGGRSFGFGHPSVDSVTERLLNMGIVDAQAMGVGSHGNVGVANAHEMIQHHEDLQKLMGSTKQRKEKVQQVMKKESGGRVMQWIESDDKILGKDELEEFHDELMALEGLISGRMYQLLQEAKQTKRLVPPSYMQSNVATSLHQDHGINSILNGIHGGSSNSTMVSIGLVPPSHMQSTMATSLQQEYDINSILNGIHGGSSNCFNENFAGDGV